MKNKIRSLFTVLLLFLFIFTLISCEDHIVMVDSSITNTNYVVTKPFISNINITTQTRLKLEGISGNIAIIGNSNINFLTVKAERKVGSVSLEDSQLHLPELKVLVTELTDEILVNTFQPQDSKGRSYIVDYVILVPNNFEISVSNLNGNIIVDSAKSSVKVRNINGLINLNNIKGSTDIEVVNGQITCQQYLPLDKSIKLSANNGSIDLIIPQSTSSEFIASSANGSINYSNLILKNYIRLPNMIKGTLGEGRGMINLVTINGNIIVKGIL